MAKPVEHILIVGGGTAGWLTGAYLAARFGASRPGGMKITLIEASDIPIVGVGEGTFAAIKKLLMTLGADEAAFMRACSAAFKQGFRFVDWLAAPAAGKHHHYYHPFNPFEQTESGIDLLPYWLMGAAGEVPLSEAVAIQDAVCDAGKGPKKIGERPYYGSMIYAYHFDAGRLAAWLAHTGQRLGVRRLIGTIEEVNLDDKGAIASVSTPRTRGTDRRPLRRLHRLSRRTDRQGAGIAIPRGGQPPLRQPGARLPGALRRPDHPVATTTISTAKEAGWIWDIGLNNRRGVGYVYSAATPATRKPNACSTTI